MWQWWQGETNPAPEGGLVGRTEGDRHNRQRPLAEHQAVWQQRLGGRGRLEEGWVDLQQQGGRGRTATRQRHCKRCVCAAGVSPHKGDRV